MIKQNMSTTITSNSNSKPVPIRDAGRRLKVKTGLKAGQRVREAA
jgi:hypothetical protein